MLHVTVWGHRAICALSRLDNLKEKWKIKRENVTKQKEALSQSETFIREVTQRFRRQNVEVLCVCASVCLSAEGVSAAGACVCACASVSLVAFIPTAAAQRASDGCSQHSRDMTSHDSRCIIYRRLPPP